MVGSSSRSYITKFKDRHSIFKKNIHYYIYYLLKIVLYIKLQCNNIRCCYNKLPLYNGTRYFFYYIFHLGKKAQIPKLPKNFISEIQLSASS